VYLIKLNNQELIICSLWASVFTSRITFEIIPLLLITKVLRNTPS